jgi:hypothetical protein
MSLWLHNWGKSDYNDDPKYSNWFLVCPTGIAGTAFRLMLEPIEDVSWARWVSDIHVGRLHRGITMTDAPAMTGMIHSDSATLKIRYWKFDRIDVESAVWTVPEALRAASVGANKVAISFLDQAPAIGAQLQIQGRCDQGDSFEVLGTITVDGASGDGYYAQQSFDLPDTIAAGEVAEIKVVGKSTTGFWLMAVALYEEGVAPAADEPCWMTDLSRVNGDGKSVEWVYGVRVGETTKWCGGGYHNDAAGDCRMTLADYAIELVSGTVLTTFVAGCHPINSYVQNTTVVHGETGIGTASEGYHSRPVGVRRYAEHDFTGGADASIGTMYCAAWFTDDSVDGQLLTIGDNAYVIADLSDATVDGSAGVKDIVFSLGEPLPRYSRLLRWGTVLSGASASHFTNSYYFGADKGWFIRTGDAWVEMTAGDKMFCEFEWGVGLLPEYTPPNKVVHSG